MMYINYDDKEIVWHVGTPFPRVTGRVVSFQADGDELRFLLDAIHDSLQQGVTLQLFEDWTPKQYEDHND